MIPRTFKRDADGLWLISDVGDASALVEWVDYIPVQVVTDVDASKDRYEENGHIPANILTDTTGLVAWVDYTPVDVVTGRADRWRTDADGFIPIVDDTPA